METLPAGWTEIDTLYELKGFQLAQTFSETLGGVLIAIFIGFGIVTALYKGAEENRYRRLVVYLVQAILVWFFIQPVPVKVDLPHDWVSSKDFAGMVSDALGTKDARPEIRAPRFLVWAHSGIDALQKVLVGAVNATFAKQPYSGERSVVLLRHARIRDSGLRQSYHGFLVSCYVPLLQERRLRGARPPDPIHDPLAVPPSEYARFKIPGFFDSWTFLPKFLREGTSCEETARELEAQIRQHLESDATQKEVLAALDEASAKASRKGDSKAILRRYVLYNETTGFLQAGEIKRLTAAVPDYWIIDPSTQSASNAQDPVDYVRSLVSGIVKIVQSVDQWIDHHADAPALQYRVVCYAPYAYGLAGMILVALFPIAGFVALLPDRWSALFTWARYVLWVKLWLVLWAILAQFNQWRYSLEEIGSNPENGIGDQTYVYPAIAAMYLIAPGLALVVVNLLTMGARSVSNVVGGTLAPAGGGQHFDLWSHMPAPASWAGNGGGGGGGEGTGGAGAGEASAGGASPPPVA